MVEDNPKCKYVGGQKAGVDSEVEENGVVTCTADAQVVVRLKSPLISGGGNMDPRKTPVCHAHGSWLQESDDVEVNWEMCSSIE